MKKKTYRKITDAGHGWLSVPIEDIRLSGVADKISGYSYMTAERVYLEEDVDMSTFLDAMRSLGYDVEISPNESYSETSRCRSYGSYNPYWVHNPLQAGSRVKLHDGRLATVTQIGDDGIIVQADDGQQYRVPRSNPFAYVLPPA